MLVGLMVLLKSHRSLSSGSFIRLWIAANNCGELFGGSEATSDFLSRFKKNGLKAINVAGKTSICITYLGSDRVNP